MLARLVLCLGVLAGVAHAETRILIVETRGAPRLPALVPHLEMHANGGIAVETLAEPGRDPLTFADRASQLVASGRADIIVWIAPVERGFLVFAAGAWPGRALIELVRIDAGVEVPELERTIALKVAGLLDAMAMPALRPSAHGDHGHGDHGARVVPEERATTRMPRPEPVWRLEAAGLVVRDAADRGIDGRAALGIGRASMLGRWSLGPRVSGYWQPGGAIEGRTGRGTVTEIGAALAVELARPWGPVQVFVRPQLGVAALLATGASQDGRHGRATVLAPHVGAELGVRTRLSETAWLGVVGGGERALIHHELEIDGETVIDAGRQRFHVGLTLTVPL
ncbi:MAG: hypothetical protein ACTHU0_05230 [Kofleriaceae bacterium]